MEKYTINDTTLVAIADAIRAKSGTTGGIDPANMAALIAAIESGGGSGGAVEVRTGTYTPSENKTRITVDYDELPEIPNVFILNTDATMSGSNYVKKTIVVALDSSNPELIADMEVHGTGPTYAGGQYDKNDILTTADDNGGFNCVRSASKTQTWFQGYVISGVSGRFPAGATYKWLVAYVNFSSLVTAFEGLGA